MLIDFDKFVRKIESNYDMQDTLYDVMPCHIIDLAKECEAVDAEPVVHGKWLHDKYGANFCSICMEFAYEDEEYHMIWHTPFCPHCGAKMDEEGEQDD